MESKESTESPEYFENDATFRYHVDLWYPGYVAFESVNYPGYFLRHRAYLLKLERGGDELTDNNAMPMFKRDASFIRMQGEEAEEDEDVVEEEGEVEEEGNVEL